MATKGAYTLVKPEQKLQKWVVLQRLKLSKTDLWTIMYDNMSRKPTIMQLVIMI